jgi:hypothetical protein
MDNHYLEITPDISYLIGLWQTDGTNYYQKGNKGKATIELSNKDSDIIHVIKHLIPYNYTISERNRIIQIKNKKYNRNFISISVCDQNFRQFLINCGVPTGKKSNIVAPPLHVQNLSTVDYIRGLYDGDGSLGLTSKNIPFISFITKSTLMGEYIVDFISNTTGSPRKIINPNKRDKAYNIVVFNEDAQKIVKLLYYDGCLAIERKKTSANQIMKWKRSLNKKKKPPVIFWTSPELEYLQTHTLEESINQLNRTEKSIKKKLWELRVVN